jgi:hypothetical protein
MNLRWNPGLRRFEAEFSTDFQGDLAAVKAAGFKTDGAPQWIWYSFKAAALTKLRKNKPASGLTITPEARAEYTPLSVMEARNAEIKAKAAEANKELKKKAKILEQEGNAYEVPDKGYVDASDLPPLPCLSHPYKPPPAPATLCVICAAPIYFYERQDPPTCLWCEKIVLDNVTEVC